MHKIPSIITLHWPDGKIVEHGPIRRRHTFNCNYDPRTTNRSSYSFISSAFYLVFGVLCLFFLHFAWNCVFVSLQDTLCSPPLIRSLSDVCDSVRCEWMTMLLRTLSEYGNGSHPLRTDPGCCLLYFAQSRVTEMCFATCVTYVEVRTLVTMPTQPLHCLLTHIACDPSGFVKGML